MTDQGLLDNALTYVRVDETSGCWIWTGSKTKAGYGCYHIKDRMKLAHRYFYEQFIGEIPTGLTLDHLCRTPSCVNPAHLEPVTQRDNCLRGSNPAAINARKTHCIYGHEFSPHNTRIDKEGKRHCRACDRDRWHARKASSTKTKELTE